LITETLAAKGFAPAPEHGTLITALLDLVASDAIDPHRLATLCASRLTSLVGDAAIVSLLSGGVLRPIAAVDPEPAAAAMLADLLERPLPKEGHRPALRAYIAHFDLAGDFSAPMRAHGRVVGEVVMLRRGLGAPFTRMEEQLIQAVADVLALGVSGLAGDEPSEVSAGDLPGPEKLSRREREVLALLALGHTNREIADQVHLSVRTVEWHRARIQAKLRVTGRAALAKVARTHGLIRGAPGD
jgi:DNA-binding CsgD family transcriptional regulator